ncbi:hypothetical protein O6H91_02G120100 [Diphasiastrum complanatum]|uniref:Uncharacterized protein n=1 Tax=Diphasiastrum complanatum TaxID=34168 RepID=A0ACC2EK67_DIPCM|nr:hypothetical protein O6H91_02G120100 [Diphasiastrum complanatum]
MEWSAVPKAGYPIKPLTAAGLQRPYMSFQNLLLPFKLLFSMWLSWKIIKDFRPDVVVGTGGYVAAPVCLVAALTGHPLVIQEQNACPGITNRILSQFAIKIFVAFSSAASFFPKEKCALRGNPTRLAFNRYISSAVSRRLFFPNGLPISLQAVRRRKHSEQAVLQANSDSLEVLLILGGSLGARSINLAVAGMVSEMLEKYPGRHVIWQTGVKYFDQMVSLVKGHPRLVILGFIDKMEMAFAAADLVVARAGAITCSEILVAGKPSILVPSSNVAEDHQMKNASFMVQTGASKLLLDKGLNSETLATVINDTLGSKGLVQGMSANASKAAAPYAARQIAEELLLIARKKAADTLCKSSAKICFT